MTIRTIRQSTSEELLLLCKGLQYHPHTDLKGLSGVDSAGRVVAIIGYDGWTYGSVCLHSWIGSKSALSREFLREVCRYPAESGRKVLIGNTPASNTTALRFNKHYGFKEVHRVRDGYAPGVDLIIQELRLDESCRWLTGDVKNGFRRQRAGKEEGAGVLDRPGHRSSNEAVGDRPKPHATAGVSSGNANEPSATSDGSPSQSTANGYGGSHSDGPSDGPGAGSSSGYGDTPRNSSSNRGTTDDSRATVTSFRSSWTASAKAEPSSSPTQSGCDGSGDATPSRVHVARRWYSPPVSDGVADEDVSVEPWCDIAAQIADMERPNSRRRAVWLSPRNWEAYRDRILLGDYFLVRDFDGLGGCLVTRNRHVGLVALRAVELGENVRAVVGRLICAGEGKPEWTPTACVAQLVVTTTGAVCRESVQPSEEAASLLLREWMAESPTSRGQVVSIQDALNRRKSLLVA